MTGVEMINKLKKMGFKTIKISKGSHYHMIKGDAYVIVPYHRKELGRGIYNRILKDAGI